MKRYALGALLVLVVLLMYGCAQQAVTGTQPEPTIDETPVEPVVEEVATVKEPEKPVETKTEEPKEVVREFTMTAKRFEYDPSTITVNKGDKVKITITSMDTTHGFRLPEFEISEEISPNNPVTIEFVADKIGDFDFWCTVYCGSGHGGMRGKLIVE